MDQQAFDVRDIEIEEYDVNDLEHAAIPITTTIVSPKITTITTTVTLSNPDAGDRDGGI